MQRPILSGFHPDPSICRVGDNYYVVCSSFEYFPGVPIFHSSNLQSWTQIGNVLDRPSQLDVSNAPPSGGIFAPTLRYHDGRLWMITTNFSDGGGQILVHTTDPTGPWSEPIRMPDIRGIDPDLAWDDAGNCYLTFAGFDPNTGVGGILQAVIDPDNGNVLREAQPIWFGAGGKFPEGPHLYRVDDSWYLMIAEGGTERGHCVAIGRGPTPAGPFLAAPHNPILTHRSTDKIVQSTGHADLVQRPDGSWAMVYLGTRPSGDSPQWHVLGRETFAQEVIWVDGWPMLTDEIHPIADGPISEVDNFDTARLGPRWISPGGSAATFTDTAVRPGWLTLRADSPGNFLGRRQEHLNCRIRAAVNADDGVGGLSLRITPNHRYDLVISGEQLSVVAQIGALTTTLAQAQVGAGVVLRIDGQRNETGALLGRGPDEVLLGYEQAGTFTVLAQLDGRYLSTEVAGGMTGRLAGLFVTTGSIAVQQFDYLGSDEALPENDLAAKGTA